MMCLFVCLFSVLCVISLPLHVITCPLLISFFFYYYRKDGVVSEMLLALLLCAFVIREQAME